MDATNVPSLIKAQEEAILVLSNKKQGNDDAVLRGLYHALTASKRYGKPILEHRLTQQEMADIARRLVDYGLCWEKHIFMPVQIFCRIKPLRYVLKNKDAMLGKHGQEALFDAYNHLKKYFITFLG